MKKEFKILICAIVVVVAIIGILLGIVLGISGIKKPTEKKLIDISVNAKDNQVVLTDKSASLYYIRSSISVYAKYDDGTRETVTDYEISGFDPTKIGTQFVKVTYQSKTKELKVVIVKEDTSIPEEKVIGTYDAKFYTNEAQIEILKQKTYKIETVDGKTISGFYEIVDENTLTLTMNNHPVKIVLDKENKTADWFNVVDGVAIIKTYTHRSKTGESYSLTIYGKQLIEWKFAKLNEAMEFAAFGGYYYDDLGNFIAYCLDEEYEIVLFEENYTFDLAENIEVPEVKVENYTFNETVNGLNYVYTISVTDNKYKLITDCYDGDNIVNSYTMAGFAKLDGKILILLDENNRTLLLNDEDKTFVFAKVTYSKLVTNTTEILYRLTLVEKEEKYEYTVENVSMPAEVVIERNGTVNKEDFKDGFANWGTEDNPYWVYYTEDGEFAPTLPIVGTYYYTPNLKTSLRLKFDGSYIITEYNVPNEGTYKIVSGRVYLDDKYVVLAENQYTYDGNTVASYECSLPSKFIVGEEIDYSAYLYMKLVNGDFIHVTLSETNNINLSTEREGKFVAIIQYGEYTYRHPYEVYSGEYDVKLIVHNFPATVMLNDSQSVLEHVYVDVETNMGNVSQVDKSLITIEPIDTSELGEHTCKITYGDLSVEMTYEVLAVKTEIGISIEGFVYSYKQNDPIDLTNAKIHISYNYGLDETIPCTESMVVGFTTKIPGRHVATVEYLEFSVNYYYEVTQVYQIVELPLGEWTEITASSGDNYEELAKVSFTPGNSGTYIFASQSQFDSKGFLYDAETGEKLAEDDDSGGNLSFRISYELEAGKTYYLAVWLTSSNGKVSIRVLKA